jgi:ATP-binding cassette subfamily C protein
MKIVAEPEIVRSNKYFTSIYNYFNFDTHNQMLVYAGFFVLGIILLTNTVKAYLSWLQQKFAYDISHQLGTRLLKVYLRKPYEYFINNNTSKLLTNLIVESSRATTGVLLPLGELISQVLIVVLISIMLIIVNPQVSIISIFVLSTFLGITYLLLRPALNRLGEEQISANQFRFRSLKELLNGIKTIKSNDIEDHFYKRFEQVSERHSLIQPKVGLVAALPKHFMDVAVFGGVILVLLYIITSDNNLKSVLPLLSFYVLAAYKLLPAIQKIFTSLVKIKHTIPSVKLLEDDLISYNHLDENQDKPKKAIFKDSITLDNISFAYKESKHNTIDKITARIPKGQNIAFVGSTGSGKTTFIDILVGLLNPSDGSIHIDNLRRSDANLVSWKNAIAYVPQEIFLIDDTITNNIALGIPASDIDLDRIKAVCGVAHIQDFIENELAKQYDTVVGERGVRLSGGQKQRLGLARALYRNPEVLILDEATSSLDNITESSVIDALNEWTRDITLIVIAHRISTVRQSDMIYLLDKGKIIDTGTYEDLIQKNNIFSEMVDLN